MALLEAKPIIIQPNASKGDMTKTIFLLPSQPETNPPIGVHTIPIFKE